MQKAHEGLPYKDFPRPGSGVAATKVCSVSGKLPTEDCGSNIKTLYFLEGTQPTEPCETHSKNAVGRVLAISRIERELFGAGFASDMFFQDENPLTVNLDEEENEEEEEFSETSFDETSDEPLEFNFLLD